MADKKISDLTAASTPLAGTEVLPIVQSSTTVKVSVADLTAGRAMSATALTASTGNFIVGTAGKGIDFSINTHAAGKTNEILTWYEEGTWNPVPTNLTVSGTPLYEGRYTRIGNMVIITFTVKAATSTASTVNSTYFTGLPFTVAAASTVGAVANWDVTSFGNGLIDPSNAIYTPTWSSGAAQTVTLSGFYRTA